MLQESFQGVPGEQLAPNSDRPGGDGSCGCPSSSPRADYGPQWGVVRGRVSRCRYFPTLETCFAFGVSGPHLRSGPQGAALGWAGSPLSLTLAFSLSSYSFGIY